MINFLGMAITAFRSTRSVEHLFAPVPLLCVGKNGVGKSSRFEALYWCLYGEVLHGTSPVPWGSNSPPACVTVIFEAGGSEYEVTRRHTGNKLKLDLTIDGILVSDGNSNDTMDMLFKVLPPTEIFKALVFCGQDTIGFLKQTSGDRRRVWGKLFGFDKWEKYKIKAQEKVQVLMYEASGIKGSIEAYEKFYADMEQQKIEQQENLSLINLHKGADHSFEVSKLVESGFLNKGDKVIYSKLFVILDDTKKTLNAEVDEELDKLAKARERLSGLKVHMSHAQESMAAVKGGKCSVCGQEVDDTHIMDFVEDEASCSKKIVKEKEIIAVQDKSIQGIRDALSDVSQARGIVEDMEEADEEVTRQNAVIKERRKNAQKEMDKIEARIAESKVEQAKLRKQLQQIEEQWEMYKYWHSAFSSRGIMALQMDLIAAEFNKFIMDYVPLFFEDMLVTLVTQKLTKSGTYSEQFDLELYWQGQIISHTDLSGGQRSRLEVCVQLALQALTSGEWACNVRVYDEVFDTLDDDGIVGVAALIQDNTDNEVSSSILTHNQSVVRLFNNRMEL